MKIGISTTVTARSADLAAVARLVEGSVRFQANNPILEDTSFNCRLRHSYRRHEDSHPAEMQNTLPSEWHLLRPL